MFRKKPRQPPPYLPTDNVQVLRERQRLLQAHTFDTWIADIGRERRARHRWGLVFKGLLLLVVLLSAFNTWYFLSLFEAASESVEGVAHLGLVELAGPIEARQPASADRVNKGLQRAMRSEHTVAVALRINSPGGSPVQSKRIYDEIRYLAAQYPDKPIYALIEDVGASGAYYVAAAAHEIHAAPTAIVGSIGVISAGFGFDKTIAHFDVERRIYTAGESKALLDPFSPVSAEQTAYWQGVLGATHQRFIADVRAGRGARLRDTPTVFSGLVWEAGQALELGLIDGQLSVEQLARHLLGSDAGALRIKNYTPRLSPFASLNQGLSLMLREALGFDASSAPAVQARLP